ncbi:MAG: hypothetical protein HUU50_09300 [Candidatus Brocadiae bacterium]|nr:hypothetical protein [Candidatus Brocadiia bacterium]
MLSKTLIVLLAVMFAMSLVYSEPPKKNPIPDPIMTKKPAGEAPKTVNPPTQRFQDMQIAPKTKSQKSIEQFKPKTAKRGTSYIYPPYQEAWEQIWTKGTGKTGKVLAEHEGYTFHSGSSYAWGMASSRCWLGFSYIPPKTGKYKIGLEAYQEGTLRTYLTSKGEVYAYRNIGVSIEGVDWVGKTISDVYYDRPVGEKNQHFSDWSSVGKEFFLEAGKSYWITGYSEVGGWSSGDVNAWQTTSAVSAIGPFTFEYVGK